MPKKKYKNDELDKNWEEIFDSIDMDYLPIEYISRIIIKFENGDSWDIDVDDSKKKQPIEQLEDTLEQLFEEYEDHIETIDFRLDLVRVQHDVGRRVFKFLKTNK